MANPNVWSTNWNNQTENSINDQNHTMSTNYRSMRTPGNRYSRYAATNNINNNNQDSPSTSNDNTGNPYPNLLQRGKLSPSPHDPNPNHPEPLENNGYAHNTYNQGLSFNTLLQSPKHYDNEKVYHRDQLLDKYNPPPNPHPNLSNIQLQSPSNNAPFIQPEPRPPLTHDLRDQFEDDSLIRNKRFPQNAGNNSPASGRPNHGLSSGKWRSRRAEKLKQNPHQKHSYSSNPHNKQNTDGHLASTELSNPSLGTPTSIVSPTTYKDSRFTRFTQEQQLMNHASNGSNNNTQTQAQSLQSLQTSQTHATGNGNVNVNAENENLTTNTNHAYQAALLPHLQGSGQEQDWYYKDPSGQEQGPFDKSQMRQWFGDGYFPQDLPIRFNDNTPFIQLKDWFRQGMTAFLEVIPQQWPQTNEVVVIRKKDESDRDSELQIAAPAAVPHELTPSLQIQLQLQTQPQPQSQTAVAEAIPAGIYSQYRPNTPPSSDNEEEDNAGKSNKSLHSFYDPNRTRMASIHPRPSLSSGDNMDNAKRAGPAGTDDAINYYLDGDNKSTDYDYNEEDDDTLPMNQIDTGGLPQGQRSIHMDTNAHIENNQHIGPYIEAQAHVMQHYDHNHSHQRNNKILTNVAYDRSLAATPPQIVQQYHYDMRHNAHAQIMQTPPQQNPNANHLNINQNGMVLGEVDEEDNEYNYTPSTNPINEACQVDRMRIDEDEGDSEMLSLFRTNTDPTHYSNNNNINNNRKGTNVYDPFGGQDLFANGRRNLTRYNKFNITQHAYGPEQAQIHRKYPSKSPMPTSSATSTSSTPNTNNTKPRDRKPPIRHKWPQHHFMANTQTQFQQMMVNNHDMNNMNVNMSADIIIEDAQNIHVPTKPPHHSNNIGNNLYQNEAISSVPVTVPMAVPVAAQTEIKHKKARKRRKKTKNKTKNANANNLINAINVWGSNKNESISPSFNDLQAEDEHEMLAIKRRQRQSLFRRPDETKQQLLQKQAQPTNIPYTMPPPVMNHGEEVIAIKAPQPQPQPQPQSQPSPIPLPPLPVVQKNKKIINTNPWQQPKIANPNKKSKQTQNAATANPKQSNKKKNKRKKETTSWSSRAKSNTPKVASSQNVNSVANNNNKRNNNNNPSKSKNRANNRKKNRSNNRNIEAVNKVSAELQSWLKTEIKKLNGDVEAASVAHLLLTLDDETAKTTAYHTFGSSQEVNTFIHSFLVHRSHDIQQQKNKASNKINGHQKKKKNKKSRR